VNALSVWATRHGHDVDREQLLELFGRTESAIEEAFPATPYREILARVLLEIGNELEVPVSSEEQTAFGNSVPQWPVFPDSSEALEVLKAHYRLVIVSNVDAVSFSGSQKRLGVGFDEVVTAEQVGAYKPDPRMFQSAFTAVKRWGVKKSEILHVAQSLFHDHVPAMALGLSTVWVDRRGNAPGSGATPDVGHQVKPDLTVPNLVSLSRLVEKVFDD